MGLLYPHLLTASAPTHGPDYVTALALKLACKEYWDCAEAAGQNFTGSKNGLDLTQHNSPGASGGYRTFDGVNQYADHADDAGLRVAGDFGLFFWTKITSHVDYAGFVSKYTGSADQFAVYNNGAGSTPFTRFGISTNGTGITDQIDSTVDIEDGAAHSIAISLDDTAKTISIKVDNETTQTTTFTGSVAAGTSAFRFASLEGSGFFLNGSIRMVGYFDKKLTAADITYLKNGGSGKTWAQIVADAT